MGIRKNYRNLSDDERDRFVQALYHVKSTGVVDRFAEIHEQHFLMNIHRSSHFLPWHREMLLRFERTLQEFHPDITIPYWDSTTDSRTSDPLWANNFLGQFNSVWGLGRALGGFTLPTAQQVETNQRRERYRDFWPELEHPIHNWPHNWVGGVMASFRSPGDPVFYMHHCWIDLLWARWQLSHRDAPFESSTAGADLSDPLMEWPDRTPAHVLNHHSLGYWYDTEPDPQPLPRSVACDQTIRFSGTSASTNAQGAYVEVSNSMSMFTSNGGPIQLAFGTFTFNHPSGPSTMSLDIRFILDGNPLATTRLRTGQQRLVTNVPSLAAGTHSLSLEVRTVLENGPPTNDCRIEGIPTLTASP